MRMLSISIISIVTKRKPNLHMEIEEKRYHSMKDARSVLALFPAIPYEAKDCGVDSNASKEPLAIAIAGQIERRALTAGWPVSRRR
jgi:hypothetical protein